LKLIDAERKRNIRLWVSDGTVLYISPMFQACQLKNAIQVLWKALAMGSMIWGCNYEGPPEDAPVASGGASGANGQGGSSRGGGLDSGSRSDWCAARLVLRDNCEVCHGVAPVIGAPISLVTIDDLRLWSRNYGKYIYELVMERIHDAQLPMPPHAWNDPLTPEEVATLDVWIAGGAQPAQCDSYTGGAASAEGASSGAGGSSGSDLR
jgi:hypothetical protein